MKKSGFTIIELLAGIVISSILVIVIGTMLYFSFESWRKGRMMAELESDEIFAIDMIERAIRPAYSSEIDTSTACKITIGSKSFYRGNASLAYNVSGPNLIYDPDTGVSSNEIVLIKNRVTLLTFSPNPVTAFVDTNITLQDSGKSVTAGFKTGCRN